MLGVTMSARDDEDHMTERRAGMDVIVMQLGNLAEGQARLETVIERSSGDLRAQLHDLERQLGNRVTELEKWQAGEVARAAAVREVTQDHGDDKGAQMLKVMVLALSCLAFLLYLVANGGHL